MSIRIGHLSDIHVPAGARLSLRDAFGKRITGYLNLRFRRAKEYDVAVLRSAVARLVDEAVDVAVISGDLTNLAYRVEFERAYALLQPLSDANIPWFVVPGNHDYYLPRAVDGFMEERFADHLGAPLQDGSPYPWLSVQPGVTLLGVNSAVPNGPFQAWGAVSSAQIQAIKNAKERILATDQPVVMVVHHHLGKAPNKERDYNRNLRNSAEVLQLANSLNAALVLHGHNHYLDIRDMDGVRVFAASSGISNQQGEHRSAGQVAIHTVHEDGAPEHHVAYWQGDAFGAWTSVSPSKLPPSQVPLKHAPPEHAS